jgi:hypothetical protein
MTRTWAGGERAVESSRARPAAAATTAARRGSLAHARTLGNQATLRYLEGARADGREREADQLAGVARASAPAPALAGDALSPPTRSFYEPRLGLPLDDVRVHRGPAAAQAASAEHARAFTYGRDIFVGTAAPPLESSAGRALLGHELAHVAQQASGPAEVQRDALPATPETAPGSLTNERVLGELVDELTWIDRHPKTDPDYERHYGRMRSLLAERNVRAANGALWMTEPPSSQPLVALWQSAQGIVVLTDETSRNAVDPSEGTLVITVGQLARMMDDLGVRTFPAGTAGAVTGTGTSGITIPREYSGYADTFAKRVNPDTLRTAFPGDAAEYFYNQRAPNAAGRSDLNQRPAQRPTKSGGLSTPVTNDFPAFDFLEANADLTSVKMSAGETEAARFSYFDDGLSVIQNRGNVKAGAFSTFDQAVYNLEPSLRWPPNSPSLTPAERAAWAAARERVMLRARLAVNAEDVAAYRADVARRIGRGSSNPFRGVIDAYLRASPEVHNGTTYDSLAKINAAPKADAAVVRARIAARIANTQIVSNEFTRAGTVGLARARTAMGTEPAGTGTAPRPGVRARASREVLAVGERGYGPVLRNTVLPGIGTGALGGGLATLVLTPIKTGKAASLEQVTVGTVGGAVGGGMAAPFNTAIQAWTPKTAIVTSIVNRFPAAGGAIKGVGSFGVGGATAAVVTLGSMGYYQLTDPFYNPAALDYVGAGGRAFVVGGLSGALTFALVGSAAGPIGFLVGLFVGLVLYVATDYLIGARIEHGIRNVGTPLFGPARYDVMP